MRVLAASLALLLISIHAFAQNATVSGSVLRRGVVPMPHASVTFTSVTSGAVYSTTTDENGRYRLDGMSLSAPDTRVRDIAPTDVALVSNSVGSSQDLIFHTRSPLHEARIYDILGRETATLSLRSDFSQGTFQSHAFWDGRTTQGTVAANGIYFVMVPDAPHLPALKIVHLQGTSASSSFTASAARLSRGESPVGSDVHRHSSSLDDVEFSVRIVPAPDGNRFAPYSITRTLHDGDNGELRDTVQSAPPRSVLFVGNSYTFFNDGLDLHFRNLALSADSRDTVRTARVAVGGYTLGDHWRDSTTRQEIREGHWDMIILQEQSTLPVDDPDSMYVYARLLNSEILRVGSETGFFMTWARQYDPPMIEGLAAAYDSMGRELGALVVPVGRAFQRSLQQDSTLTLHISDGSHPNEWGTYLACCTFYAELRDRSPVGIPYVNSPLITGEQRLFLQNIAWETVLNYHPQPFYPNFVSSR